MGCDAEGMTVTGFLDSFLMQGAAWMRAYGMVAESSRAGPRRTICWLAERPARWGGFWGLGCTMCADAAARLALGATQLGRGRARLHTAWARFESRPAALQSEHVRQHQNYDLHRVAVAAWLRPDSPIQFSLQATLGDEALLAGHVPQADDWLRCWRACRTPQSWSAAAQVCETEHFIRPTRERAVQRRPLARMAAIIREVVRTKKRDAIRKAAALTLAFDDRAGYKLLRFRIDRLTHIPAASLDVCARPTWKTIALEGIVGCLQCLSGSTLADFADDYAERTAREIMTMLKRFCTPLAMPLDENLFDHMVTIAFGIVADGALQKTAAYLREAKLLPNILLILRDPSHFVRIACRDPIVRTGRFEAQHKRLFTDKDALFKKITFSDGLKARLEACQKLVLGTKGKQGGDVTKVMKHFCFAPHRFESWVEPRRRYACILHAVALLLAEVAGNPFFCDRPNWGYTENFRRPPTIKFVQY